MIEGALAEGLADAIYREAGLDPAEPTPLLPLVRALWSDKRAVEMVPGHALRFCRAMLVWIEGRPRIYVRHGLEPEDVNFLIGHELAHWVLRRDGLRFETEADEETAADQLGAALVAPARALRAALRELGPEPAALARAFYATQSLCALRVGEVTGQNLALVRPGLIRVRGQLEFVWPDDQTITRWARGVPPRGLVKTRLTDDPKRVLLLADDLAANE